MFGCIDPGMAVFMAETSACTDKRPDTVDWVALAAAFLLATTIVLVAV